MQITLSAIKADIGGIGGHTRPSDELFEVVKNYINGKAKGLLIDYYVGYTGDDIHIIMTHTLGIENQRIHQLAWDAFTEGTKLAKEQGLYGAGQDLLKDAFSGNIKGLGPGVAEMHSGSGAFDQMAIRPWRGEALPSASRSVAQGLRCPRGHPPRSSQRRESAP